MAFGIGTQDKEVTPVGLIGRGLLAGAAGTAVMTVAQTRAIPHRLFEKLPSVYTPAKPRYPDEAEAKDEPATEVAARRFVEGVAHRPLRGKAKTWAGHLVHYGTGAVFGALYALSAPRHTRLWEGLLFGTAVWMFNDNLLVPAMRIADWPRRYPLGAHVKALVAHLVYGGGTALALRRSLKNRRLH